MPMMSATADCLFFLPESSMNLAYGPELLQEVAGLASLYSHRLDRENWSQHLEALSQARLIFSSWGMARLDESFLQHAPKLEMVFYGAGSIRGFVTEASWNRGVRVCSAVAANAIPVAEYALSQILFCLKRGWQHASRSRENRKNSGQLPVAGAYRSTVGLLSLGSIGRLVAQHLKHFDVKVIAYEPFMSREKAAELGVELVSLDEVFARADVVSCHTPWLPETEGLLTGAHFSSMKLNSTFINTARGAVVNESGLIATLQERPDLFAVLDVTWPEPPPSDSPFYDLPNVVLTPHIAGSIGPECRRMGQFMVDDLKRFLRGEPLKHEVTREQAKLMA